MLKTHIRLLVVFTGIKKEIRKQIKKIVEEVDNRDIEIRDNKQYKRDKQRDGGRISF